MTKKAPRPESNRKGEENERSLLLVNDDVNSFEHVISSLVNVCGHDEIQAEQCAVLTHIKGGCVVKVGDAATIGEMSMRLKELSLETVVI
jgi:ATP-dependent Clp protease adaptor protein ClpS